MSASTARKDPASRRAKGQKPEDQPLSRAESEAGGVRLPQNDEPVATISSSSGRRKRRPRKLAANAGEGRADADTDAERNLQKAEPKDFTISVEVQALKSKVQEIEAQVQEILLRPAASQGPTKSARRRARYQKGQGTTRNEVEQEDVESGDRDGDRDPASLESREELESLQRELQEAQGELFTLKAKKASSLTGEDILQDDDDVEEIPRLQGPGLEVRRPRPLGRAVTLSGSYRIPIPVNVSDTDLDAISRGIKSAQNIARTFIDSDHARNRDRPTPEANSGSWSQWFGGYSMSIAKAVDKVRITSNLETVPQRPVIVQRAETAPPRRKPQKLEVRGKKRPGIPGAQRKLSETQVAGLLA